QTEAPAKRDKPKAEVKPKFSRDQLLALRADVRKCEDRVEKLNDMGDKLAARLANPALYEDGRADEATVWQKKYAEVREAMERAEAMWVKALEKLEKAGG